MKRIKKGIIGISSISTELNSIWRWRVC